MKRLVFWNTTPCRMIKLPTFRKYRSALSPHSKAVRKDMRDPEDEGNTTTRIGGKYLPVDTA